MAALDDASAGEVPFVEVEPWTDHEPEDDEALRQHFDLTARRTALGAMEMRSHLIFQNLEQMSSWSGGTVAMSSRMLGKVNRDELHHAVHRFAPLAAERAQHVPEECEIVHEDESCSIGAASDVCMLERAFLLGADGDGGGDGDGSGLVAFACARHELYSFALTRLHDYSAAEVQALLEERSTATRLQAAEERLERDRTWLASRLGLGNLKEPFKDTGATTARDASVPARSATWVTGDPAVVKAWREASARLVQVARLVGRRRSSESV